MEIAQLSTSLLKWSSIYPHKKIIFLERFYQKFMEVMLEIGLMSDIFMNWRRAKSDIFYFSSCKSMKKCIYSSYIFQMMWN